MTKKHLNRMQTFDKGTFESNVLNKGSIMNTSLVGIRLLFYPLQPIRPTGMLSTLDNLTKNRLIFEDVFKSTMFHIPR